MGKNIIALAGPPCSGKSTAGKILSVSLGSDFIDIDHLIKQKTGHSITWIFEHEGEDFFRILEKKTLASILLNTEGRAVVSLGGGALLDADSRRLTREKTILFTLTASAEVLAARNSGNRPLATSQEMMIRLLSQREEHYSSLGLQVNTENRTPREIAEIIRKEVLPLWFPQDLP